MGGSKSSCFNIIACRCGDPVDGDELRAEEESKASSDKLSWSFRKRSSSRRVVINADASEPVPVSETKEKLEVLANNIHLSKDCAVGEKEYIQERPRVTFSLPSAREDTEEGNSSVTIENSPSLQEYDSIIIQSYIRGFLASKELKRRKSIVKLQAAVRGHLVRRQAVGTLWCLQAIVKMQALIRARHARRLVEKLSTSNNEYRIRNEGSVPLKGKSYENPNKACSSIEKLFSNSFACQLLESSPKGKINIKCDPSKSDSAWKWLERWTEVTTLDVSQQQEQVLDQVSREIEEGTKFSENENDELTSVTVSVSSDIKLATTETDIQNVAAKDASNFEFNSPTDHGYFLSSFSNGNIQSSQLQNELLDTAEGKTTETERTNRSAVDSLPGSLPSQLDPTFDKVDPGEHGVVTESELSETLESDGKKHLQSSSKSRNPVFAAVQSKFEELSSKSYVTRSSIYTYQDAAAAKSRQDSHNIQPDSLAKTKETSSSETLAFHDTRVHVASTESSTKISISSTLDSPDISEIKSEKIVLEVGDLEREKGDTNVDSDNISIHNMVVEEKKSVFLSDIPESEVQQDGDNNMVNSIALVDSVVANGHSVEGTRVKNVNGVKVNPSEESPRSQATIPSVHSTPSSHISTNAKKMKKDSSMTVQKQKSLLAIKRSPTNSGNNSGRSSTEHVPKDKSGKRRDSFGTTNIDQEPRISSSNSLPSYMQATVSARAKAHTNSPPKMSPDVHDNPTKKRHSLPIENSKHNSSPNMHRSASQTQQNSRTGTSHSPQNSAERRWQR